MMRYPFVFHESPLVVFQRNFETIFKEKPHSGSSWVGYMTSKKIPRDYMLKGHLFTWIS